MPCELNKEAWEKLIDEDIEWLMANTEHSLERWHILDCLKWLKDHKPRQ